MKKIFTFLLFAGIGTAAMAQNSRNSEHRSQSTTYSNSTNNNMPGYNGEDRNYGGTQNGYNNGYANQQGREFNGRQENEGYGRDRMESRDYRDHRFENRDRFEERSYSYNRRREEERFEHARMSARFDRRNCY